MRLVDMHHGELKARCAREQEFFTIWHLHISTNAHFGKGAGAQMGDTLHYNAAATVLIPTAEQTATPT
jgi:hypothetical protein